MPSLLGVSWNIWIIGAVLIVAVVFACFRRPRSDQSVNSLGAMLTAFTALFFVAPTDLLHSIVLIAAALLILFFGMRSMQLSERKERRQETQSSDVQQSVKAILAHLKPGESSREIVSVLLESMVVGHRLWMFTSWETTRQFELSEKLHGRRRGEPSARTLRNEEKQRSEVFKESRARFDELYRGNILGVLPKVQKLGVDTSEMDSELLRQDEHLYGENEAHIMDDLIGEILAKYISAREPKEDMK